MTKEAILAKYTNHYEELLMSHFLNEHCVTPKEAFDSMEKYATQQNKSKDAEILELKATIVDLDQAAGASAELMVRVMELEEENGRLKEENKNLKHNTK